MGTPPNCELSTSVGPPKKAPTSPKIFNKLQGKHCFLGTCGGLFWGDQPKWKFTTPNHPSLEHVWSETYDFEDPPIGKQNWSWWMNPQNIQHDWVLRIGKFWGLAGNTTIWSITGASLHCGGLLGWRCLKAPGGKACCRRESYGLRLQLLQACSGSLGGLEWSISINL